ncbi:hypothetical protein F4861DRAFT_329655 [Xylaria intraflava]|nr:hypothetical protein F4861DRAFT_329655 [Xylaria intraflava]
MLHFAHRSACLNIRNAHARIERKKKHLGIGFCCLYTLSAFLPPSAPGFGFYQMVYFIMHPCVVICVLCTVVPHPV